MASPDLWRFLFLAFSVLIFHLPECNSQASSQACGPWPEGATLTYTCKTQTSPFTSFEPRLEYNNTDIYTQTVTCDSTGICFSYDPAIYNYEYADTDGWWNVSAVYALNRSMTASDCFLDGQPLDDTGCDFYIYARPKNMDCSLPQYPRGQGVAVFTCTADVYPDGKCNYEVNTLNEADLGNIQISESSIAKLDGTGDRVVTCTLEVEAAKSLPGSYGFSVYWEPYILSTIIDSARETYTMNVYDLILLSLVNIGDENKVYEYPSVGYLEFSIDVLCNPGPVTTTLEVKYDNSDPYVARSDIYSMQYTASSSFVGGTILISVFAGFNTTTASYFRFRASNGLVGDPLEIFFTVNPLPSTSSPPMAETTVSSPPPTPPQNSTSSSSPPPPPQNSTSPPPPPPQNSTSPPPPPQNSTSSSPPPPPTQDPGSTSPPPPPTQDPGQGHDHGHGGHHYHHNDEHHEKCHARHDNKDHTEGGNPGNSYGYYPGVGYGPYPPQAFGPYPGMAYGPWPAMGYVNPRFGGMVYRPYPPFPDMGWGPYRGWFPWFG